eukprot:11204682-Prorocentrum_lima.AAC.1
MIGGAEVGEGGGAAMWRSRRSSFLASDDLGLRRGGQQGSRPKCRCRLCAECWFVADRRVSIAHGSLGP